MIDKDKIQNPIDKTAEVETKTVRVADGFYTATNNGVFLTLNSESEEPANPIYICGPIEIESVVADSENNKWGNLVKWKDALQHEHQKVIHRKNLILHPTEIIGELCDGGLDVNPKDARSRDPKIIEFLLNAKPAQLTRTLNRIGWVKLDEKHGFVLPDQYFGSAGGGRVIYAPEYSELPDLTTSGSLQDWQDNVAKKATCSSRAVLAICANLAGPLLHVLDKPNTNFGIHIRGNSSSGKSVALMIGASVSGSPKLLRSWSATINGLEGYALASNDLTLHLDEINEKTNASRELGQCIYKLMNGTSKGRANVLGNARPTKKWRLIVLSSGEQGLAEILSTETGEVNTGLLLRLVDVPADARCGFGVNETLPSGCQNIQTYGAQMKEAVSKYYGTALRAWLSLLFEHIENGGLESLNRKINSIVQQFVEKYAKGGTSQIKRVAEGFGLLVAAGELASGGLDSTRNVTSWESGTALRSIKKCFLDWQLNFSQFHSNEAQQVVDRVLYLLEEKEANFLPYDKPAFDEKIFRPNPQYGWIRQEENADGTIMKKYYFQVTSLKKALGYKNRKEAMAMLIDSGLLVPPSKDPVRIPFENSSRRVWIFTPDNLKEEYRSD